MPTWATDMTNESNPFSSNAVLPRMLSDKQVAELIGVNKSTIFRWVRNGTFPKSVKVGGTRNRRPESQILEWMADPEGWVEANQGSEF
jgi:prophage regulatory protein